MNFKVGQKVVCIKNSIWLSSKTLKPLEGNHHPRYREIVTINSIEADGYLELVGFPEYTYDPTRFRPLDAPQAPQEIEYTLEGKKLIETPSQEEMQEATYSAFDFKGIDAALIPEIKTGIIKFMGNISKIYSN